MIRPSSMSSARFNDAVRMLPERVTICMGAYLLLFGNTKHHYYTKDRYDW